MSLSNEESSFLRFYFLNLTIASKAVRVYFDSVHPPPGLANDLAKSSVTLKGLRFITKLQQQTLYPSPAYNVRSEDFDSTLIVCLLRNMTPRESAPVTGWDNLPLPGDASKGADLARIKWYRNMVAHHGDGKLSPTEFSQYWADLEGAINRLGGPLVLKDSQSAQNIVLDSSLTNILNKIRLCEISQKGHENQIQQLHDSLQKSENETKELTTKLSDTTGVAAKSKDEIKVYKKKVEKIDETIKVCQEQSMEKQKQIDKLIIQVDKLEIKYEQHDKMLKEHGEHLDTHDTEIAKQDEQIAKHDEQIAKHDEQMSNHDSQLTKHGAKLTKSYKQLAKHNELIATHGKDIDDIKKKQHDTDDSSNESKRKRLEDDIKGLIEEDLREGTFVTTVAVTDGSLLLKQNGVLLITGHAGTGKSRISRHILHMFCMENTSYKCIKLNKLQEWEDIVRREDNVVVLLDDIFGETNCIYDREKDIPILDKIYAYVCKGNIKVMITIRDTVKRQCQEVLDSHRLFKFDFVGLSSDKYKLSSEEKTNILTVYMKTFRQSDLIKLKGFVDQSCIISIQWVECLKITNNNPVKGFPLLVYQFVHNDKYFQLGSKFFDRPTEAILNEINEIRRQGETHKKFMIQYGVMVYSAINEKGVDPDDNSNKIEVKKIVAAIYGESITIKNCNILDAVKELEGSYLVKIPNQRSFKCHHQTLQESIILSFARIDEENINKIIPLLSWKFFINMVKPNAYQEKGGEVVLKIPANSYKLLAKRLVEIYIAEFRLSKYRNWVYEFLGALSNSEIFQQEDCVLLTYLLEAVEKTDHKHDHSENMIRCEKVNILLCVTIEDVFLAFLLVILAEKEKLYKMFQIILQRINQIIKKDNTYFTIYFLTDAIKTSLYRSNHMKDVRSVQRVKALLDIVEENKIPVLVDQHIKVTSVQEFQIDSFLDECYVRDTTCVFITLCIENAYENFNIPLLEYLIGRYYETQFDVNLFLKWFYSTDGAKLVRTFSSGSHKPLKWMINKFKDQVLIDIDFILRFACDNSMIDIVEYLAPKCKTFDAISYLRIFMRLGYSAKHRMLFYVKSRYLTFIRKDMFDFLFSKIDITSTDLTSTVMLVLEEGIVPDFIFDAFLPVCLNNKNILNLACTNAHFYVAKQIMEKSQNVDFQTALSSCVDTLTVYRPITHMIESILKEEQFKLMKYIIEKFGYENFDLKAVCQQAYNSEKFKIIEWLILNIDCTLLNVDFIRNSALEEGGLEILEYTIKKIKLSSLEKRKVLKSITQHYTSGFSTRILEIISTVWDSTEKKDELQMEEIVIAAYKRNCFNLLLWIYDNCNSYISTDGKKLLMLACESGKVELAMWACQTFELNSLDIDGGNLFKSACDNMLSSCRFQVVKKICMVNLVLRHFKIKPLELKLGLLRLISITGTFSDEIRTNRDISDDFNYLLVSIAEKCFNRLSTQDMEIVIHKTLYQKCYVFIDWFLENDNLWSFDKQVILNKACADAAFKTIKLVSKYFSSLDMTCAMINACILYRDKMSIYDQSHSINACLDLLWKETDHASIDISRIVSAVCREEDFDHNVMTWILQNFQHNQIPINEVLINCCKNKTFHHVNYILYEVDNEQLDINEAFCHACRETSSPDSSKNLKDVMLVDLLFQKLPDKTSSLSFILEKLLKDKSYNLILYFLKNGYYRNIDMNSLMSRACRIGHVGIIQWILANVQHTNLDIKSAIQEAACTFEFDQYHLQCIALVWHYIQDINMLDIGSVLKFITEAPSNRRYKNDLLMNWMKNIQKINQRKISKSETSGLNTKKKET